MAGFHYVSSFSICPFIFLLSGDLGVNMCSSPAALTCLPTTVRTDRLCIVVGRVACRCHARPWLKVFFRLLCCFLLTSAACQVFDGYGKPHSDQNIGPAVEDISQRLRGDSFEPWWWAMAHLIWLLFASNIWYQLPTPITGNLFLVIFKKKVKVP